jgi:hypothetical protein
MDTEFVMAAPNVLHQRVAAHDHAGGMVAFEVPHRTQPRLEPSVIGLNPIIRILLRVVERCRHELIDHRPQRRRPIVWVPEIRPCGLTWGFV